MINTVILRSLGKTEPHPSTEELRQACLDAADLIDELCKQMDGCIQVAKEALGRVEEKA